MKSEAGEVLQLLRPMLKSSTTGKANRSISAKLDLGKLGLKKLSNQLLNSNKIKLNLKPSQLKTRVKATSCRLFPTILNSL